MIRPTSLFRSFAPARHLPQQPLLPSPSLLLTRRLFATTTTATTTTDTPSPIESSASSPPGSSSPTPPETPATQPAPQKAPVPYYVGRTASKMLPVYHDRKSGGNRKLTYVKRIEGDVQALRKGLAAHLGLTLDDVKHNPVTGHLHVKGNIRKSIINYLKDQGF